MFFHSVILTYTSVTLYIYMYSVFILTSPVKDGSARKYDTVISDFLVYWKFYIQLVTNFFSAYEMFY